MKVLALDYGSARTGVAVSDPTGTLARPVATVARVDETSGFDELVALVRGAAGCGNATSAPPTTTTPPPPPKPFRIVFPEGFTRVQMAVRVKAVAKIAVRERHKRVLLNEQAYLAASKGAVVRCFGRTKRTDVEGFLFPATYDFLRKTTGKQLVAAQLAA